MTRDLNVLSRSIVVDKLLGAHKTGRTNNNVQLIQFHNGSLFYLLDGIGTLFPNLASILVGYADDADPLNTKLIRRSNFQNMKNLFEIVVHKSRIETVDEDLLWDLPNLERFHVEGKIKELPERLFEVNTKLKEVYLASNALRFLPANLFRYNLDLDWVNFVDNSLTFILVDFMLLPNIRYIFLDGNVCIDKSFNRTVDDNELKAKGVTDFHQVGRVLYLQEIILSNCSSY